MTPPQTSESLFTYLNRKADEWKKQMNAAKAMRTKPRDPLKEQRRHDYNKQQGML